MVQRAHLLLGLFATVASSLASLGLLSSTLKTSDSRVLSSVSVERTSYSLAQFEPLTVRLTRGSESESDNESEDSSIDSDSDSDSIANSGSEDSSIDSENSYIDSENVSTDSGSQTIGFELDDQQGFKLLPQADPDAPKTFLVKAADRPAVVSGWKAAGWQQLETGPASLHICRAVKPCRTPESTMVNLVTGARCVGGHKGNELRCKLKAAAAAGCAFNDLGFAPRQFNLEERVQCQAFFAEAEREPSTTWIVKAGNSFHGYGVSLHRGPSAALRRRFGSCKLNSLLGDGSIAMRYIENPLLVDGRKFDLRTYMLIASTRPWLVFFHKGYVRRAGTPFDLGDLSKSAAHIANHHSQPSEDHYWSYEMLNEYLRTAKPEWPTKDFMYEVVHPYTKRAAEFLFRSAQRTTLERRKGAFMYFAMDWSIDDTGKPHFLEGNWYPAASNYTVSGIAPGIYEDMAKLVTRLHRDPASLQVEREMTVRAGYAFGGWQMIVNEAEDLLEGRTYDLCAFDPDPWTARTSLT